MNLPNKTNRKILKDCPKCLWTRSRLNIKRSNNLISYWRQLRKCWKKLVLSLSINRNSIRERSPKWPDNSMNPSPCCANCQEVNWNFKNQPQDKHQKMNVRLKQIPKNKLQPQKPKKKQVVDNKKQTLKKLNSWWPWTNNSEKVWNKSKNAINKFFREWDRKSSNL